MRHICILLFSFFTFLVSAAWPQAQAPNKQQVITFDAPRAGTSAGQGTFVNGINPGGAIVGWYVDGSNVSHGFLRRHNGTIITFDTPGAGTGSGEGTFAFGMNSGEEITGSTLMQTMFITATWAGPLPTSGGSISTNLPWGVCAAISLAMAIGSCARHAPLQT